MIVGQTEWPDTKLGEFGEDPGNCGTICVCTFETSAGSPSGVMFKSVPFQQHSSRGGILTVLLPPVSDQMLKGAARLRWVAMSGVDPLGGGASVLLKLTRPGRECRMGSVDVTGKPGSEVGIEIELVEPGRPHTAYVWIAEAD